MILRIFTALLAALALFVWGWASHMLLPLGEAGLRTTRSEKVLLETLQRELSEPGLYLLPGEGHRPSEPKEAQEAFRAKYRAGPTAMVVYQPRGEEPFSRRRLVTEFVSNLISALLATILVGATTANFLGRVSLTTALGLFAWVTVEVPYWNWYRFSDAFVLAAGIQRAVGWFLAGLVLALMLRPNPRRAS